MSTYKLACVVIAALAGVNFNINIDAYIRVTPAAIGATRHQRGLLGRVVMDGLGKRPYAQRHEYPSDRSLLLRDNPRCEAYATEVERKAVVTTSSFRSNPVVYCADLLIRYINAILVGLFLSFFLVLNNKFVCHDKEVLLEQVFRRKKNKPLLTVSNHLSVMDDPGLWAGILPWWFMSPDSMRWVLCTEDVFFANKFLSRVMALGNTMPLDRNGSLLQGMFRAFYGKLSQGKWCHIFSEGKIWQRWRFDMGAGEDHLGPFKIGTGMLIAHCAETPVVIPMYHRGMDEVVPEVPLVDRKSKQRSVPVSLRPQRNRRIHVFFGEALDFTDKIRLFREKHPGVLDKWGRLSIEGMQLYTEITREVRDSVLQLERRAYAEEMREGVKQETFNLTEYDVKSSSNSNSNERAFV